MSWRYNRLAVLVCAVVFLAAHLRSSAQADTIIWSTPRNLSNTLTSSGRPAIVADGYGYVHVFWSEEVGGPSIMNKPKALIHTGNTIVYTRWDGVSWTPPMDILFIPGDSVADYAAVTVGGDQRLHVVWSGVSNFYYSTARPEEAHSAQAWSEPIPVATDSARSQWESDVVTEADGSVHIVYATRGDEAGVYHIRTSDGGATWGLPTKLSLPLDELEIVFSNTRLILDGAGRLHVVWQTSQEEGFGQGIYYARSTNGGADWSQPVRMAYRDPDEYGVSFPSIASVGASELHMVYIDGPWHIGRYHRISRDGGATWSEPQHVFTDYEGINGYPLLLVDGAGQLHLVITWRTKTQLGGTYFARWLGTEWSRMEVAVPEADDTGPGAHWTAAAVRLGNELHVLWNTNFTDLAGEIWHARGVIPWVTPTPARMTPQGQSLPVAAPAALSVAQATATTAPADLARQRSPMPAQSGPASGPASLEQALLVAVLPALLLVLATVTWFGVRTRRHAR